MTQCWFSCGPLIGEKQFESVEDLVADGLIVLHMEKHNVVSFIDDAREAVKQTSVQTLPAPVVMPTPLAVSKSDIPFRRMSLSSLSPVFTRRDRPGRLSLRPGRSHTEANALSAHEVRQTDADGRPPSSLDDLSIQPPKRSGSLRLFKAKSFEKQTLASPLSAPSLALSSTATDVRLPQVDPLLCDKRSPLIGRASGLSQGNSFDDRLPCELSPPQSPKVQVRTWPENDCGLKCLCK